MAKTQRATKPTQVNIRRSARSRAGNRVTLGIGARRHQARVAALTAPWPQRPALLLRPDGASWSHAPIKVLGPGRREGVVRIAVTGASGRIGGQVVRLVAAEEQHQVVALSRPGLRPGRWPPGVSARAAGEDPWWMYAFSTMFASIREQRWAAVSSEVHRLTGRPPTPVRTTLARYHPV